MFKSKIKIVLQEFAPFLMLLAIYRRCEFRLQCTRRDRIFKRLRMFGSTSFDSKKRDLPSIHGINRVLWIGADDNQDNLGFLEELRSIVQVDVFANYEGALKLSYSATRSDNHTQNAKTLLELLSASSSRYQIIIGQFWPELIDLNYPPLKQLIKMKAIKIICVAMDDFMPARWLPDQFSQIAGPAGHGKAVDLYATSDVDSIQRYASLGLKAIYLPFGCSSSILQPGMVRDLDVVFVGSNYGQRKNIIESLVQSGINVHAYGPGFTNGRVSSEQIKNLYSRAKIILGICNVGYQLRERNLKTRDFDAISSKALYIANACNDFNQFFSPNLHYIDYSSFDELLLKIRYYLANSEEASAISERGYRLGMSSYRWRMNLSKVINVE